jgi:hypothetical protein
MQALFETYRVAFQGTAHLRIPEIQARLAVGFEFFLRFLTRMKAIDDDTEGEMLKRAWKVFEALGEKHSRIIERERPTLKFMAVLQELFLQGRIYVESATVEGAPPKAREILGWQGTEPARTRLTLSTIVKSLRRRPSKSSSAIKSMDQHWLGLTASDRSFRSLALTRRRGGLWRICKPSRH